MGRFLRVERDRSTVMAATPRPPAGMDHLTVVPTNYDADATDEEPREADDE
jgi:hypothetical protein